jgi:DNA-binding NtrC family response regulator
MPDLHGAEKSLRAIELGSDPSACLMQRPPENASIFHLPGNSPEREESRSGVTLLVVEPTLADLLVMVSTMSHAGFHVTAAETFEQARPFLTSRHPSILVTALRLGAYNGLHLVLRGKAMRPEMAALVISDEADVVLQTEAEAMGATFMVKPIAERELLAAVRQTFFRRDPSRPIRPPFERRQWERRVHVATVTPEQRIAERRRIWPGGLREVPRPG